MGSFLFINSSIGVLGKLAIVRATLLSSLLPTLGSSWNSRKEMVFSNRSGWCETRLPCSQNGNQGRSAGGRAREDKPSAWSPVPFGDWPRCLPRYTCQGPAIRRGPGQPTSYSLGSSIMRPEATNSTLCSIVYKVPSHPLVCKPVPAQSLYQTPETASC